MGTEKEIVSTRVHPDLHEAIEEEAISRSKPGNRISVSQLVREVLEEMFENSNEN